MTSVEAPAFKLDDYLEQRVQDDSFVMVELGHGRYPMVDQQPHSFTGQQAYIGIEAGMRGRVMAEHKAEELRKKHDDINAFFLLKDLGPGAVRVMMDSSDEHWDGEFDPTTILADGAADEVVASNVFCDPLIALEWSYTTRMLEEAARLVTDEGMIVLRETITPWKVVWMDNKTLAAAGLERVDRVTPTDSEMWANLEDVYGTHSGIAEYSPYPSAYYLFLAKTAAQS